MSTGNSSYLSALCEVEPLPTLLAGSSVRDATYNYWYELKRFVVDEITTDAARVLDIGCGNGFLLLSARHWLKAERGIHISIYGVDRSGPLVARARALDGSANFEVFDIEHLTHQKRPACFSPEASYEYIHWAVWDDYDFGKEGVRMIRELGRHLVEGGSLLLTFWHDQHLASLGQIDLIRRLRLPDLRVSATTSNPHIGLPGYLVRLTRLPL